MSRFFVAHSNETVELGEAPVYVDTIEHAYIEWSRVDLAQDERSSNRQCLVSRIKPPVPTLLLIR
jgi:hypothetical protein